MNRFRLLRKEKGLTQIALQMRTGIDQSELSKYEVGVRLPTVDNLIILADFYGTSMDYLMGRTNERAPYPRPKPE